MKNNESKAEQEMAGERGKTAEELKAEVAEGFVQAKAERDVIAMEDCGNNNGEKEMKYENKGKEQAETNEAEVKVVDDDDEGDKDNNRDESRKIEPRVIRYVPRQIDLNCDPDIDDMETELAGPSIQ